MAHCGKKKKISNSLGSHKMGHNWSNLARMPWDMVFHGPSAHKQVYIHCCSRKMVPDPRVW